MKPIKNTTIKELPYVLLRILAVLVLLVLLAWASAGATEYHVAKTGNDAYEGSREKPFLTISRAASLAVAGDIITVHAGIYRELVVPKNGGASPALRITYRAAPGEKVEIKGSEIIRNWKQSGRIWKASIPNSFFGAYNPYLDLVFGDWFFPGRNKVHTGEVYLNGKPLGERAGPDGPDSWSSKVSADSTLITCDFGHINPNEQTVEINVRPSCIYPERTGVNFITIKGFHLSQAATQWAAPTAEQTGIIGTNWSKGWIIEDNTISDSKCVGIALGKDRASGHNLWFKNREIDGSVHYNNVVQNVLKAGWSRSTIGSHLVRNNTIYRCGQAGVAGSFGAAFSEISGNHIYDIYTYRNFWGAEMAGIKLHAGIDALIKNNRIHNAQKGIWLDWMTQGTRISSNLLYDNDFVDIFLEVNHGPYLVDNNFFLSPYNLKDLSEGGVFVHNLFSGLIGRSPDARTTPYFKPNSTTYLGLKDISGGDDRFCNNIFIGRKGRSYFSETYPSKIPDEIDSLAGYGLAVYDNAKLPVQASGNLYLNGAYPFAREKNPTIAFRETIGYRLDTQNDQVLFHLGKAYPNQNSLPILSTQALGKNANGHPFTHPDGSALAIDQDYSGQKRKPGQNPAGPAELKSGSSLKLWPFKKNQQADSYSLSPKDSY